MEKSKALRIVPHDLVAAVGLLTRLPVPVDGARAMARGAAAAWAYPVVGMLVGAILAAVIALTGWIGLPAGIVAGLVLVVSVVITGAMHEDGLADSADGLWGGWDPARRLEIMKDSHIGAYGVIALVLSLLLRWFCLAALVSADLYWAVLIAGGALSRAAMVTVMAALPHARNGGLSQSVGRPAPVTVALALGLAAVAGLVGLGPGPVIVSAVAAAACGLIARAKIGGQTGDILGATQQITEVAVLFAVIALI